MEKKRSIIIDNKNVSLLPDHANVHPGFQKIIESGFSSDPITSQAKPDPGPDLLFFLHQIQRQINQIWTMAKILDPTGSGSRSDTLQITLFQIL